MATKKAIQTMANMIRNEMDSNYLNVVPVVTETTDVLSFANPILSNFDIKNNFLNVLINKIVSTQVERKVFSNPLSVLDGETLPLGQVIEDIYINPNNGRNFDINDFEGLLKKYESDIKVQYIPLNCDRQYVVTISDQQLKMAFTSWEKFGRFVDGLTQNLYNQAYIERYNYTKSLVAQAYLQNKVVIDTATKPTTEAEGKALVKKLRNYFLNFQLPSTNFNAWEKIGGYGRRINTFTSPEDIVIILRNDIDTELSVDVLAAAFNMDKTTLMGNIIRVDDFTQRDNEGNIIQNADEVMCIISDKSFFRINQGDFYMDDFKNANNRTRNYYLNDVRGYNISPFANAVVIATKEPEIKATSLSVIGTDTEITKGIKKDFSFNIEPVNTTEELEIVDIKSGTTDLSEKVDIIFINKNTISIKVAEDVTQDTVDINLKVGSATTKLALTIK